AATPEVQPGALGRGSAGEKNGRPWAFLQGVGGRHEGAALLRPERASTTPGCGRCGEGVERRETSVLPQLPTPPHPRPTPPSRPDPGQGRRHERRPGPDVVNDAIAAAVGVAAIAFGADEELLAGGLLRRRGRRRGGRGRRRRKRTNVREQVVELVRRKPAPT